MRRGHLINPLSQTLSPCTYRKHEFYETESRTQPNT
jgi:hypothetical protein